jgi:hypothetical protein
MRPGYPAVDRGRADVSAEVRETDSEPLARSSPPKLSCFAREPWRAPGHHGADLWFDPEVDQTRMNPTLGTDQPTAGHRFSDRATLEHNPGHVLVVARPADDVEIAQKLIELALRTRDQVSGIRQISDLRRRLRGSPRRCRSVGRPTASRTIGKARPWPLPSKHGVDWSDLAPCSLHHHPNGQLACTPGGPDRGGESRVAASEDLPLLFDWT